MKTIAIIGLSDKPERPSWMVGDYLKSQGYQIIPVNPTMAQWQGIKSWTTIGEVLEKFKVDIVDIFRKPEEVVPTLKEISKTGKKPVIWLQEGVGSEAAKEYAQERGLEMVMDHCLMKAVKAGVKI